MTTSKTTVLIIEDEMPMRRFLRTCLSGHDYAVFEASRGEDGIREAASRNPELILLDLGLPDIDGVEVTRRVREWSTMPIIVLTARGDENEKIRAFEAGADDYLTKPFLLGELLARMRVARRHAMRRAIDEAASVVALGPIQIDFSMRQVLKDGSEVHLSPTEYKLLTVLAKFPGRMISHQQLLKEVWGARSGAQTKYLHVYMGHLRSKLETDPARPQYLTTEPGVGYRLRVN